MSFTHLLLSMMALSVIALWLSHLYRISLWRKDLPQILPEIGDDLMDTFIAYQHYFDFRPLPEHLTWLIAHGLVQPTSRGRWMLSGKGRFVSKTLGLAEC